MSRFKFGRRSQNKLDTVIPELQQVATLALKYSDIDFGVVEGIRTLSRQKRLDKAGASKTLRSKHLDGHALDVLAYLGRRSSYNSKLYYKIAEAFQRASVELGIKVRWGGCWQVLSTIGDIELAVKDYVMRKQANGKTPFLDFMHFEIIL